MNKIREYILRYKTKIFIALVIGTCLLGAFFALKTVDRYEIVVKAVLGLTVLIELYMDFQSTTKSSNEPDGIYVEFPRDFKHVARAFLLTVIGIWAGSQVVTLIWLLISFIKR
ncbi:MAG: hypothetical protein ABI904_02230 [Chloroflexota bacterium]